MKKRKPGWFKLSDIVNFGFSPAIAFIIIIYVYVFLPGFKDVIYFLIPFLIIFTIVYVNRINKRVQELSNFIWFPKYGIMVEKHNYGGDLSKIDEIVKRTTDKWEKLTDLKAWDAINYNVIWVWFKPGPVSRIRGLPRLPIANTDISIGYDLVVGYKFSFQALEETDLPHELGHLIQGRCTGVWDEIIHHSRARKFGLS